jgi:hypothetical protein
LPCPPRPSDLGQIRHELDTTIDFAAGVGSVIEILG